MTRESEIAKNLAITQARFYCIVEFNGFANASVIWNTLDWLSGVFMFLLVDTVLIF